MTTDRDILNSKEFDCS